MRDATHSQLTVIGHDADVDHTSGGKVTTTHGRVVDLDDNGFVVIMVDGRLVYIPKDKVESIKETVKAE